MKYSANYSNKIKLADFDEIIIRYDMQEVELLSFLREHSTQSIILSIDDVIKFSEGAGWRVLNAYYTEFKNLSVRFYSPQPFQEIPAIVQSSCANLDMPYFFGLFATNFDHLHYLLQHGASQVYVAEDLCFDLIRAKRLCAPNAVQLRTFPNVCQAAVKSTPALKKFFIRPEDITEYEDCIDVCEFWGPLDRQEVLLRIYKKGIWFGDLQDLILELDIPFDSRCIVPIFARVRKECKRECMKGGRCGVCDRIYNISGKMQEKNLLFTRQKND